MIEDTDIIEEYKKETEKKCIITSIYSASPSSISEWKYKLREEIRALNEGLFKEFDHDRPIDQKILDTSKDLIEKLPFTIFSPELSINNDGSILLEWARKEYNDNLTMFSIVVNGNNIAFSLMHCGKIKYYATALYSDYSIKQIIDILDEHFEKPTNSRRVVAR